MTFWLVVLAVGAAQLAAAAGLRRRLGEKKERSGFHPAVTVLVPVKGSSPWLKENIRSMLEQDYPGKTRYIFVVPSERDPAFKVLNMADSRVRVLASGRTPSRSSGKNADLLFGLEKADTEVLLFADADVRVPPCWISSLASPLADPKVGCSTASLVYAPEQGGLWSWLRSLWVSGALLPLLSRFPIPWAGSMALRRRDLEALGIPQLWARSFNEDGVVDQALRRARLRTVFVAEAMTTSAETCGMRQFFDQFNRWMLLCRLYTPFVWLAAGAALCVKAYLWLRSPLLMAAFDAAYFFLIVPTWRAAAAGPFMPWLYLLNFLRSAFMRRVRWGGTLYVVRGPQDVEAVPEEAGWPPCRPEERFSLLEVVSLLMGGALCGLAFWPGLMGWWMWVALVPLFWAIRSKTPRTAFRGGWIFGCMLWLAAVPWMWGTAVRFLGSHVLAGTAAYLGVLAWHGLMLGILAAAFRSTSRPLIATLCAALALEAWFPKLLPMHWADTQAAHLPAVQSLELFGTAGLSALLIASNMAVFSRRAVLLLAVGALALANEGYGRFRMVQLIQSEEKTVRVGLVQGALPLPGQGREERIRRQSLLTGEALKQGPVDLVIWPETSYERELRFWEGEPWLGPRPFKAQVQADIPYPVTRLLGVISRDPRLRNTAVLADASGSFLGTADKMRLYPFGEYLPLSRQFPLLRKLFRRGRRLSPGREQRLLITPEGVRLGALICYEDLLPELSAGYGKLGADLLVDMTEDVWFDSKLSHEQHLRFAALRAVENRRSLVRAVNAGVTAIVDPVGRIQARIPTGQPGVLVGDAVLMGGRTASQSFGKVLYVIALLGLMGMVADRLRR
ncbi:MAG: apolipoprotein N-acyltransferase [Elusimicrobiota bacterium]